VLGSPRTGRGGLWSLVPPASERYAESCVGPQPVGGLPAGSPTGIATAEDRVDQTVKSIVEHYLGPCDPGPSTSVAHRLFEDDNMSVTGTPSPTPRKRRVDDRESSSDSDMAIRPARNWKVLRSRVIGSGSDNGNEPIVLSDSPQEVAEKVRGRRARAQRLDNFDKFDKLEKLEESIDVSKIPFTDCPSYVSCEDLNNKDVDEMATVSEGWLNDIETARSKSKRMNGKLSGIIKDRIVCLRSIIKSLAERVKDTGDVQYLRRKNDELASQLRESRKEESRLQSHLKEADARAERLNTEIVELRRRISSRTEMGRSPPPSISR